MNTHELQGVRNRLLQLHKLLLEDARGHFERLNGPISSPYAFLDLLVNHEFFAWLRVFSQLVVTLDEGMEKDPSLSPETGFSLIRAQVIEGGSDAPNHQKLQDALARLPEAKKRWEEIRSLVS